MIKEITCAAQSDKPGNIYIEMDGDKMYVRGTNGSYIVWDDASLTFAGENPRLVALSKITETLDKMLAVTKLLHIKEGIKNGRRNVARKSRKATKKDL